IMLGGRLRATVAAFAYRFSNLQVNTYDPGRVAYVINNAGSVRQRGAEVELNYQPVDMLTLHGSVAYTHNRFRNFVGQCYGYAFPTGTTRATAVPPPNCSFVNATALTLQQDFAGRAPARSPDWAGEAGAEVKNPQGDLKLVVNRDAL
ncbi:MAG: TonB-dependent receptor, partial [Novosphingobium sp.]